MDEIWLSFISIEELFSSYCDDSVTRLAIGCKQNDTVQSRFYLDVPSDPVPSPRVGAFNRISWPFELLNPALK